MAKYYRFMSFFEFLKMSLGEEINPINEYTLEYHTTSKGICFFGDKSFDENDENRKSIQALKKHTKELLSDNILVEFEALETADIHESIGIYEKKEIPEYWISSYDYSKMIPLRYQIAIGSDLENEEWTHYDRNTFLQNPKELLKKISSQRRKSDNPSITKIDDWCSEFSLLSEEGKGWYIERDKESKTITLSYGNMYSKDRKPTFSLSFKQESEDKVSKGLEEYKIANYSWSIDGDIPEDWKDLSERFSELSKKQVYSGLPYSHYSKLDTICSFDYSYAMSSDRIAQLMKYAILKATYPDIINRYKLSFDGVNPGRFFESIGLPASQNPFEVPPLRLDTINLIADGFVLNNLYKNNPIFFSSNIKNRNNSEKDQEEPSISEV